MNKVLPALRYVGPTIAFDMGIDGLLLAPHALPLDFVGEIELHVFNFVILVEVSTAGVEIQLVFVSLAVVHKAIDCLCAGVAKLFALVVAGLWRTVGRIHEKLASLVETYKLCEDQNYTPRIGSEAQSLFPCSHRRCKQSKTPTKQEV
uniref:Uncharacterized protein n=1 Tax=Cucumis melo TaxID=3656 RepID=A0A9I9EH90_CUCME